MVKKTNRKILTVIIGFIFFSLIFLLSIRSGLISMKLWHEQKTIVFNTTCFSKYCYAPVIISASNTTAAVINFINFLTFFIVFPLFSIVGFILMFSQMKNRITQNKDYRKLLIFVFTTTIIFYVTYSIFYYLTLLTRLTSS